MKETPAGPPCPGCGSTVTSTWLAGTGGCQVHFVRTHLEASCTECGNLWNPPLVEASRG